MRRRLEAAAPPVGCSEAALQAAVVDVAQLLGWWVYHTRNSRGSNAGWPDLTLIKPPRVVFMELKTVRGRASGEQLLVLDLLRGCGVPAFLFRPSDWTEIIDVLLGGAG